MATLFGVASVGEGDGVDMEFDGGIGGHELFASWTCYSLPGRPARAISSSLAA